MATVWKVYRGGPTKVPATVPNISINSKHVITFNRRALELINNAEAVMLQFEEKNSIIGIVPTSKKNTEAFPVRPKGVGNWVVNAAPFCTSFQISVDRTERFDMPDLNSDGILCLDLRHTHNVSRKKARSQKTRSDEDDD